MSGPHLDEWQRRSFDISSGSCSPGQTANALRAHLLSAQYAWASSQISQAAWTRLLRIYSERYASILDSDDPRTGLNNYAESALHLAQSQRNHSEQWESGLSAETIRDMPCVRRVIEAQSRETGLCCKKLKPEVENITVGGGGFRILKSMAQTSIQAAAAPSVASSSPSASAETSLCRQTLRQAVADPSPSTSTAFGSGAAFSDQSLAVNASNPTKRKAFCISDGDGSARKCGGQPAPASAPGRSFKTAREQLIVEHQRKQSNTPPQRGHTPGLSAATKKSLGANRPRGTFSKFVSPLPRQEEEQSTATGGSSLQNDGSILDERLKIFEPKIVELIMSEIMDHGPPISWDDIAGLDFAKATIKEIVVWPMLRPDIFTGLRGPPKGILLFGPPGTGKTLIGKCIACQSGATFFSISASSLTSKWVGEGEKMVRALFAIARCHQPAVIFIDEIDSLLSQRSDSEHESSRRIKTEFLVQLDGATTAAEDRILVVGATNRPQEIDEAARRRLAKRLYIPLPEGGARRQIVSSLMSREKNSLHEQDLQSVVSSTEGFSGADMTQLCREAALGPIRSMAFRDISTISADQVRPISYEDFQDALRTVRPSVSGADLQLYEQWNQTFGCGR